MYIKANHQPANILSTKMKPYFVLTHQNHHWSPVVVPPSMEVEATSAEETDQPVCYECIQNMNQSVYHDRSSGGHCLRCKCYTTGMLSPEGDSTKNPSFHLCTSCLKKVFESSAHDEHCLTKRHEKTMKKLADMRVKHMSVKKRIAEDAKRKELLVRCRELQITRNELRACIDELKKPHCLFSMDIYGGLDFPDTCFVETVEQRISRYEKEIEQYKCAKARAIILHFCHGM